MSPDGEWLVYRVNDVDNDELYAERLAGGPRVLLSPPADSQIPIFRISPDSRHVVFTTGNLWSVPIEGGTPTRLDDGSVFGFSFTPDSEFVAYKSDEQYRVSAIDGSVTRDLDLTDSSICGCWTPPITSDGTIAIAYASAAAGEPAQLMALPLDGSPRRTLAPPAPSGRRGSRFQLSSDDRHVVYHIAHDRKGERQLYSARLDGGGAVRLNRSLPENGDVRDFAITPDGIHVVYRADQRRDNVFELWAVPTGGGSSVRLNRPLPTGGDVTSVLPGVVLLRQSFAISPDSSTVVYRADERTNNVRELFAVGIDGRGRVRLTKNLPRGGDVNGFQISPDGSTVVFRADQRTNNIKELFAVPLTDGPLTRLSSDLVAGGDVRPAVTAGPEFLISPDSQHVAYIADQDVDQRREAFLVPIDGGDAVRLNGEMHPRADARGPLWFTPDSGWVGFESDGDDNIPRNSRVRVG